MSTSKYDEKSFDSGFEKPAAKAFAFGKPGDVIKGTLVAKKPFEGKFGETIIYSIEASAGQYHQIVDDVVDKDPTEIKEGEEYSIFERSIFKDDISRAVVGQEILIRYVEDRKSKNNGKMYKYIVCKLGAMPEPAEDEKPF